MGNISKYLFKTKKFERAVVPGSARGNDEPGLPGTIDFKAEPQDDNDRGNKLEKWLDENTVSPSRFVDIDGREGNCYMYMNGKSRCSVITSCDESRDNRSSTDPLKYQKTAVVKVQPIGPIPTEISQALQRYGYEPVK